MGNYRYDPNRPWDDPNYQRHELAPPLIPIEGGLALGAAIVLLVLVVVLGIVIWG